jgi:hypothetical protein
MILFASIGAIAMVMPAFAQQVHLRSFVIGSGGTLASSGSTTLAGTIGQPVIGPVAGSSTTMWQGFWYLPPENVTNAVPGWGIDKSADGVVLYQNMPNPFSSTTELRFKIPHRARVSLKVYDAVGHEVRSLLDEETEAGIVTLQMDAEELESGYYTARLVVGGVTKTIGMIVVR